MVDLQLGEQPSERVIKWVNIPLLHVLLLVEQASYQQSARISLVSSALVAVISSMHSDKDLDPAAYAALPGIFFQFRSRQSMHHVPVRGRDLQSEVPHLSSLMHEPVAESCCCSR